MITFEQIGMLLVKYNKCKFPNPLLRNGLIRFIDGNESNQTLENFEITELGIEYPFLWLFFISNK